LQLAKADCIIAIMIIKTSLVRILSFGFASGICLYPFVLIGKEIEITDRLLNHERIHLQQQLETLIVPFYLLYFFEFFIRILQHRNVGKAYRNISFEKEAYQYESEIEYLDNRKRFAWTEFLGQSSPVKPA
jgi:hypothetical protein